MTITYNKQVILKRGNTAVSNSYTGPIGEITYNTDTKQIRVHDGVTVGGTLASNTDRLINGNHSIILDSVGNVNFPGNLSIAAGLGENERVVVTANKNITIVAYSTLGTSAPDIGADLTYYNFPATSTVRAFGETSNVAHIDILAGTVTNQQQWRFSGSDGNLLLPRGIHQINAQGFPNFGSKVELTALDSNLNQISSIGIDGSPSAPQGAVTVNVNNNQWTFNSTGVLSVPGNVIPVSNITYSLGDSNHQWKELWVSGNTIYIGGTPLTVANETLLVNNAPVTGGGGVAGNIAVNLSGINFVSNSSGDGNGFSTIQLRPDTSLNSDQYLIIDPTYPTHIHIRAGGPQDNSTAELFLGGESNHVRVRDGIGVKLQNDLFNTNFYSFQQGVDYDTATWSTDESGNHWLDIYITDPMNPSRSSTPFDVPFYSFTQFPQNRIEVFDGTNYTDLIGNGQAYTLGNQYQLRVGITQAPATNPTSILSMTFRVDTLTQNGLLLENNEFDLSVNQSAYIYANQTIQLTTGTGNFRITTADNSSSYSWYFTAQGYLQFPQGLAPTTSKGKVGDEVGCVVFDASYIYYCTADYTDGLADIWKRVAWSNDTW